MDEMIVSVCAVCFHLLTYGEYIDGTDAAEVCAAGMERIWSGRWHLVPGSHEFGFSTWPCEGCGDTMIGDRFEAFAFER